jgi:hypothetical protein
MAKRTFNTRRSATSRKSDKRLFRNTALRVKPVTSVSAKRGGIML